MFFCKSKDCQCGQRTLSDLKNGEKGIVRCVTKSESCNVGKLSAMGLTPGTEVEMLSNAQGPLMIMVRSGRLCLCRNLARNVIIE